MSRFQYSGQERDLNKVLKMNQDISLGMLHDVEMASARGIADANIESSVELLLALERNVEPVGPEEQGKKAHRMMDHRPELEDWGDLVRQADECYPELVALEDIMSASEINESFRELDAINKEFSRQTSLINKTDLSFLAIATALQVAKVLLFPYVAGKAGYGTAFDPNTRLNHDAKSIKKAQRTATDAYRDKTLKKDGSKTGEWIEILYRTPPYDITKGSGAAGLTLHGGAHRLYTLGHDPVLGWIFGTMNILTDIITTNDFQSRRVTRNPMKITNSNVGLPTMVKESYQKMQAGKLNLPAAVFAQAQHFKSDEYTKMGLPVPVLSVLNEQFASKLYSEHYDALCFSRDVKIVGISFVISVLIDMVIALTHGLFREETVPKDLYEVRTRKILLISNSIASTSTIIHAAVVSNPKVLDIGSLLNTLAHLFLDVRFISRIKQEYVESKIQSKLQAEMDEIDRLYSEI